MKTRFFALSAIAIALLVLTAGSAFAASASLATADDRTPTRMFVPQVEAPSLQTRTALDALLFDYDVVELPLAKIERQVRTAKQLDIFLAGERFELRLEVNDLRAPGYKEVLMTDAGPVELPQRPVSTYAGTVVGHPDSVVRLTATRGLFSGYVKTGDDWLFVDPLREFVPGASKRSAVVYRESDVRPEASGLCGVTHRLDAARDQGIAPTPGIVERNHTSLRRLQVATDADGEYYSSYGNPGTFTRIQGILNDVDGIYRSDLNLYISITYQQAWPNAGSDPYTSNDAVNTLYQFRSWWQSNRGGTTRDTAHLFSGKNFNGGTIGVAWVGVICNSPSLSYGVSQNLSSGSQRAELTAHEIGHNLSAQHDDQIGCANCNGFGPIMCSFIQSNGSGQFSGCSQNAIDNHTHNNGSCLN